MSVFLVCGWGVLFPAATARALSLQEGSADHAPASQPASAPAADTDLSPGQPHHKSARGTHLSDSGLEDLQLLNLEIPTVVSAARREQSVATVPYAVSVITKEDIRWSGARSVPDALRLASGVDVAELAYGAYAVSPRGFHGFTSNEVLVLVDGRQIYDALYGGTLWGSWPFQLEDIERIEVIRSPGGVTWGANTANGVINIITKDPKDQLGLTATGGGGTQGANKEHLGYAFSEGKLRLRVSGEYEGSDGFPKGGSFLGNVQDDYKSGRAGVHGIYEAGPRDKLMFSAGSGLLDGGYPPQPLASLTGRRNPGSQANYLMGEWTHRFSDDNRLRVTGYVNDCQAGYTSPAIDYRYQQLAFQIGHTFKPAEDHTFTWGMDSRVDLLDGSNADPFLLTKNRINSGIVGLYAQDEWRFAPRWTFNLGGRVDYDFYGGFQPSARGSLSYALPDDAQIYTAVSRAFAMPPAGSRNVDMPQWGGLVWISSDRDMAAETVVAYETGYRKRFWDRLDANLNLYWNDYDDLKTTSTRLGPPGLMNIRSDSIGAASTYGAELDLKYAVNTKLTLLGNYTYEQLDWDGPGPYTNKGTISAPRHKFMLGARYSPLDRLHLSSHLYFVDDVVAPDAANPITPRHVPEYFRLDLRAEYEFWKDQASVAVGVRNLLDANHYEGGSMALDTAEVPRMVYAELRIRLGG